MHPMRRSLLWLNVLGGLAVLGSYVHGLASSNPLTREAVWGGVPEALRPFYAIDNVPRRGGLLRLQLGALFFCLQTALLDALIWPVFSPL